MRLRKGLIARIVMIIAIVAVTSIIFFNSFEDIVESHHASGIVVDVIRPNENTENDNVELLVRKTAHLIEYAVLGIAVMLFVKCIEREYKKRLYAAGLFYVLLVAVLDEHIQSYSDRTSSTSDILLDFFGALIGFGIALAIFFIYVKLKNRKKSNGSVESNLETNYEE